MGDWGTVAGDWLSDILCNWGQFTTIFVGGKDFSEITKQARSALLGSIIRTWRLWRPQALMLCLVLGPAALTSVFSPEAALPGGTA